VLDEPTLLMSDREATQFMRRLRQAQVNLTAFLKPPPLAWNMTVLFSLLCRLWQREWGNPVIVIASQQPRLVPYADVVAILHKGQLLQVGSPQEVLPSPSTSPRPHHTHAPPPPHSATQGPPPAGSGQEYHNR
jgi:energy-coupling factor transporter ATP-binding protein EcfA2